MSETKDLKAWLESVAVPSEEAGQTHMYDRCVSVGQAITALDMQKALDDEELEIWKKDAIYDLDYKDKQIRASEAEITRLCEGWMRAECCMANDYDAYGADICHNAPGVFLDSCKHKRKDGDYCQTVREAVGA